MIVNGEKIDSSILKLIELCNEKKFKTKYSCSGVINDHKPRVYPSQHIRFNIVFDINNDEQIDFIENIAKKHNMMFIRNKTISIMSKYGVTFRKSGYVRILDEDPEYDKGVLSLIDTIYNEFNMCVIF